jgi:two-component system chemotaxis sensor kinase CheA
MSVTEEELRTLFVEESSEQLAEFQAGVLRLERTPGDAEAVAVIFRLAHSLKGSSGMMRFTEIMRFTHGLETLLDRIRTRQRPATPEVIDVLLACGDVLRHLVQRVAAGPASASTRPDDTVGRVQAMIAALLNQPNPADGPAGMATPDSGVPALYRIVFRPSSDVLRRGLDPIRMIGQLAELGELGQVVPDLDALPAIFDLEPTTGYLSWSLTVLTTRPPDELEACLRFAADPTELRITPLAAHEAHTSAPREPARRRTHDRDEGTVIRVTVDKVDRLLNQVGEMMITQSMLAQAVTDHSADGAARIHEAVARMDRHAHDLHHSILDVRMVSVKTLFSRLPRFVRDLAQEMHKQAILELSGEETELDKSVIEKISDPLMHLVRNAIDHGLESPAVRRAAGKAESGRLQLHAYQRGGNVYIEVSDDGRGLDRDRILARAVAGGFIASHDNLRDEEVLALIFLPGFSTADTVSEVSGRGVGMDVVKQNVEDLGGSVAVSSETGRGTRVRIKLPLTLAVVDGQILQVGHQVYVLPLAAIVESVRPLPGSVFTIEGAGELVMVGEATLPLLRLGRVFGVESRSENPTAGLVVIVEHEDRRTALLVDGLLGQQQVVIKSLETHFRKVEAIAGATILGDGRVSLILDVPGLIGLARRGAPHHAAHVTASPPSAELGATCVTS